MGIEQDFESELNRLEKKGEEALKKWEKKLEYGQFKGTRSFKDGINRIRSLDLKYDKDAKKIIFGLVKSSIFAVVGTVAFHVYAADYIYKFVDILTVITHDGISLINSEINISESLVSLIYQALISSIPGVLIMTNAVKEIGKQWLVYCTSFEDRFRAIGVKGIGEVEKIDVDGKTYKVNSAPKLLREHHIDKDTIVRIFTTGKIKIDKWKAAIDEIDQEFNWNIYKLELSKTRTSVIMTIVSNEKAEELKKRYKLQQDLDNKFEKIGLHAKGSREIEYFGRTIKTKNLPEYIGERKADNEKVIIKSFKLEGSELQIWKEYKYQIENILETNVVNIQLAEKSKQIFEVLTVKEPLKPLYEIKDERYFPVREGELILGEGLLGLVKSNLKSTAHILIAGVTDSGKSVLFELLIWQMIKQGHYIIPIDFKGGVNMRKFEEFGPVTSTYKRTAELLKDVRKELKARLALFNRHNVENIYQYHDICSKDEKLSRIIVCVDELAEIMDKSGVKKKKSEEEEDNFDQATIELLDAIEGCLSTIARLGRAVGVHLIAATQRPDAKVITGQIKNNMSLRISGRMTDVQPSMMVVGSNAAVNLPAIKGRFVMTTGADPIRFQAPYFKREHIKPGYYRKGRLLVLEDEVIPPDDFESHEDSDENLKDDNKSDFTEEPTENMNEDINQESDFEDIEDSSATYDEDEADEDEEIIEQVIDLSEWDQEDEEDQEKENSEKSSSKYNF